MLSSMTSPTTAVTITPVTITGGDDSIPPDSLLQSETYITAEMNARFETAKPNKADFVVEKGKEVDLATPVLVESESKMEVQMMKSVAQTVTPVHKYYCEPVSGKKFRSMPEVLRFLKTGSKRKKSTGGNATILGHLLFMETWFLKAKDKNGMLSSRLCLKGMQIGMQHRDLIVVDDFLLWRRHRQKVLHLNSVHDVQV
ncbi:hypothetical protein CQW23_26763 [Capsicum baccatum]|uniref:MBD domain-containing protein n=1 Tax=Capsicum baccatum TaxID=33114 RepID=A0A2G2VPT0_CAPBA|nr:hypothetical protein CQW23_26763 [Capsicum baccatum]